MPIADIPLEERPREKLLAKGAKALGDAELLALLLRTGTRGHDVFALADEVLTRFGGFAGLLNTAPEALRAVKGLGPAKRAEIAAVMEMCRRALAQGLRETPVMGSLQVLEAYLASALAHEDEEVFAAMFLDARQRLLSFEPLFRGTLTHTAVHPRTVLRRAIELKAAFVVVAHNHPSGVAEPSSADEMVTRRLMQALELIDVKLLDHFVVGRGQVVSLSERGRM